MAEIKLTNELTQRIADLVRGGNYRETACAEVGIDARTMRGWLRTGAQAAGKPDEALTEKERRCIQFSEEISKAEAASESGDVRLIGDAAAVEWRAAAWRLEKRFPTRWGPKVQVIVDQEIDRVLDAAERVLAPEVFRVLLAEIASCGSESDGETPAAGGESAGPGAVH